MIRPEEFTPRNYEMWRNSKNFVKYMKDTYGMDFDPRIIYKQITGEAGQDYYEESSPEFAKAHNFAGLTQASPTPYPQPKEDGDAYYRTFGDDARFFKALGDDFYRYYDKLQNVSDPYEAARILKKEYNYYGKRDRTPAEIEQEIYEYGKKMDGIAVPPADTLEEALAAQNNAEQPQLLLKLPQQNYFSNADYSPSLRNQFMQHRNPYAEYGNPYSAVYQQNSSPTQVQQPRPSTSSLLNLPSYQNTPQVDMSRWTPYNNVQFTQQGTQNRDNFVAGVRNWATKLFGGRSE